METEKLAKLQKDWVDINEFKARFEKKEVEEFPNNVFQKIPEPVVSVHIVTYQHVDSIRKTIDGALMQKTTFPFEIIIGDDFSTDGTREICIEYAEKYPDKIRLFLHQRENNIKILGKACGIFQIAYNTLQLRGEFIATCSGDDYWTDDEQLEKQVAYMRNEPSKMSCYSDFVHNIDGKIKPADFSHRLPLCTMNRNIFRKLPIQFVEVLNEDQFFLFVLDLFGDYGFVSGIKPSVYTIHDSNLWYGRQNKSHRAHHSINTAKKLHECFKSTEFEKQARRVFFASIKSKGPKLEESAQVELKKYVRNNGLGTMYFQFELLKNIQIKLGLNKA